MDNNDIMLTVIIVTYNHEDSIAKALDSVLEQETTYPYEIWLCEDCSTDATLSICKDYAKRYPDKIKLFTQTVNTYSDLHKVFHYVTALKSVKTKYLCMLDGDDAWCDKKKIQIALDILEDKPEYVIFAHDTMYNNRIKNTRKSMVHEIFKTEIQNPVTFETAPFFHTSARIYRNVVKFSKKTNFGDIYLFYSYLDKGPLYYYDKIMSVYNKTGKGVWSGLPHGDGKKISLLLNGTLNKYFNYKYDLFFTRKVHEKTKTLELFKKIFGMKLGWDFWMLTQFKHREFSNKNLYDHK